MSGRLVDSHAHLQARAFAHDADAAIAAAELAGVERLLVPGWDLDSSRRALTLSDRHPVVDAAVGVHPHAAGAVDRADWQELAELAADPRAVAIGETGLDYDRLFSPREAQLANLRRHLELALALGLPVILHCRSRPGARDAHDDLLRELRDAGLGRASSRSRFVDRPPALLHSFSGPLDYAAVALELGLAVSFSGLVFRAGEEATVEVARLVPADRLLVETDAPYLSPPGAPHRRNEPEWVRITFEWLARARSESPDELGARLVANYDRLFRRRERRAVSTS